MATAAQFQFSRQVLPFWVYKTTSLTSGRSRGATHRAHLGRSHRMWNCRRLIVPVLVLAFAGAARAEGPENRTFVGPCGDDKTARIGVVADNGMMVAYLCSQDDAFNTGNARWFTGTVSN